MISYDPRQIESLQKLEAFFDFFLNPEKYQNIAKEVKDSLKGMNETITAYSTITDANRYLDQALISVKEANKKADELVKLAQDKASEITDKAKADAENLYAKALEAKKKDEEAQAKSLENLDKASQARKEAEDFKKEIEATKVALEKKSAALDQIKVEYEEKLSKLKQVIG